MKVDVERDESPFAEWRRWQTPVDLDTSPPCRTCGRPVEPGDGDPLLYDPSGAAHYRACTETAIAAWRADRARRAEELRSRLAREGFGCRPRKPRA